MGSDREFSFQSTAELPDIEGKGKRKDRPGHQDPFRVGEALSGHSGTMGVPDWLMNRTLSARSRYIFYFADCRIDVVPASMPFNVSFLWLASRPVSEFLCRFHRYFFNRSSTWLEALNELLPVSKV